MKFNLTTSVVTLLAATIVTPAFSQTAGSDIYKGKCQMCHLADGTGNKGMKVPAFKIGDSAGAMTTIVKNGAGTGAIKMPAYAGKLTDDQIKAVVAYVHTLAK
jgi:mono/diheme cytochrome c family protein